jgi:predicted alpha/beta hydrolase family esterase
MKLTQVVYMHGGEAFDGFWEGMQSYVMNTTSKVFSFKKRTLKKWPDFLETDLSDRVVIKLKMPSKYNAKYAAWKHHFEAQFKDFDDTVILLGWSLGGNFMAKYLAENTPPFKIESVHLVAPCFGLGGGFWLSDDFPGRLKDLTVHLYHSKDDFVVDFSDFKKYEKALPRAKTHVFTDRNHFLQTDFPELIETLKPLKP